MKTSLRTLLTCLGLLLLPGTAFAQGTIRGVVTDSLSGESLPGANVFLPGTALGSATDVEGRYRIDGVPAGRHVLRVSYLGYETLERTVDVVDGRTLVLDLGLVAGVIEGDVIVVTGQMEGQTEAINRQLTANTIVNVVSEEKIQELPDANAAEAVGRLPGVSVQRSGGEANKIVLRGLSDRFTSITVNGVRLAATDADARGVDLSTIAQGSLAGIELYKALTPDKDADAIAGSVNFVTKTAPRERLLRVDARGAYNDLDASFGQYDFALRYGERFFGGLLGVQVTGNLEQRDRSREHVDLAYDLRGLADGTDYRITNFTVSYTDEVRRRRGAGLLLDLATPDGGTIRVNNIYNYTARDYVAYDRNYPTDGGQLTYGARDREQAIDTYSGAVTGENYVLGLRADWGVSLAHSSSHFPFDYDLRFTEPSTLGPDDRPASHMMPIPTEVRKGPPEALIPYALNNFGLSYLYTAFYRGEENDDTERTAFLDLARDYTLAPAVSGQLKVGGKYRSKHRDRARSELFSPYYVEPFPRYVRTADGAVVDKGLAGTRFAGVTGAGSALLLTYFLDESPENRPVYGKYDLYPILDRDALREWWDLNRNGVSDVAGTNPEYERNREADAYFYDVAERISAAYAMNTFNLGRFATLLAGVRVEHEDNDYRSRYAPEELSGFPVPNGAIRDTSAVHRETVWLPNAHLTLRPFDFLNVRLAAYKALARPNFNHRLNSFVARREGTFYAGNVIVIGNPDLRAAEAWNYEVNTSVFGDRIGLLSVSAFYKDVAHMYHTLPGIPFLGTNEGVFDSLGVGWRNPFQGAPFQLTYPFNSTRPTRVWGLELEHQTNFWYLPGLLRYLVLSYNVSVVRSETYIPQARLETYRVYVPALRREVERVRVAVVENEQKLEGQPEVFGNVALGFDTGTFSARVSVFHQGEYYDAFSPDRRSDTVVDGFTRWDLAFRYNLSSRVSLMLNVNNVTGVDEGVTTRNQVTGWNLVDESELYGRTADLGVRVTF